MNQIGRRIYYDLETGNVLIDTGERQGSVLPTTIEQDVMDYVALSERNRNTFNVIELAYGQYAQDFADCIGYRVNVESNSLEFSYPDPNEPNETQPYQRALSEIVNEQMDYLLYVDFRLSVVELGIL